MRWFPLPALALLATLLLVACGGTTTSPIPPADSGSSDNAPPPLVAGETPSAGAPQTNADLPQVKLERVFPALAFRQMTGMYQALDGRFFVTEQPGRILIFDNRNDVSQASVFLDITGRVDATSSEMGLLGLALAPDFVQSGVFYVDYTAANPRRTVISRFTAPAPRTTADAASESVILEVAQPFVNHNGGQIAFGPDGYLYIAFGDGGGGGDPMRNGQNRNVLLGKLLRIDVAATSSGRAYRVPADNPFVGQSGARDEVWAYGLRNPWRFSFDAQTGALWAGDVGQNAHEEVDVITKGGNYGWNITEGNSCLSGPSCNRTGLLPPVIDYPTTSENCAVTGGFVHRGSAIAGLRGAYVYGDYCSGHVWALRYDGQRVTQQSLIAGLKTPLSSFAVDAQGELYALSYASAGGIYKLAP